MSALIKVSSIQQKFEHITAMVSKQDKIILVAKIPRNFLTRLFTRSYNIYVYSLGSDPEYLLGSYRDVPDMTNVRPNTFALIDRGSWFSSQVRLVQVEFEEEKTYHMEIFSFETDRNCCGITFFDNHFFLTYSGKYGCIKMLDVAGEKISTFSVDLHLTPMFSTTLSKIVVTEDHKLHVSDVGKNQLTVVKLSLTLTGVSEKPTIEAEHNRMAVNSIIKKGKNELFIATGGQESEIVLMSTEGPKRVLRNYEITGVPTALCRVDDVLYVATCSAGWFSTTTHILGFKDSDNTRPKQCLISMQD